MRPASRGAHCNAEMTPFKIQHRVPWADVDLAKIVYFPRYFSYFEMAEMEWHRSEGWPYEDMLEGLGIWMPRVAAHCNYHAPARLADLLSIELHLERLGRTSYTFGYDAFRLPERTRLADGYVTIATVARGTFRPTPVPQELVTRLKTLVLREPSTRKK